MKDVFVIKLIFGIMLTFGGYLLLFLAFKLYYKYLIQEKRCTSKTEGIIKKYTLFSRGGENSGVNLPVVYYTVDGKEYKVVGPEYKKYITITKSSPLLENELQNVKEDNQTLIIKRKINSIISVSENPIKELYPINSKVDVYYNPNNPKLAYVLRYCDRKNLFYILLISAIVVLILDITLLIII